MTSGRARLAWSFVAGVLAISAPASPSAQVRDQPAAVRATGTASISGVVLSAESPAAPLRLARVTLTALDRAGLWDTATTDANGRFAFRNLPAGRYAIQGTKRAWLDANFGAERLGRPGTPIAVREGESRSDLTIRLTRGAVITGTVRDPGGEPQPGVIVRVMQYVTRNGARALERPATPAGDLVTDDQGAYRAYGLPPGEFIVVASLRFGDSGGLGGEEILPLAATDVERTLAHLRGGSATNAPIPPPQPSVTNAPVFFPGVSDLGSASTVTLTAGMEREGVDIPFRFFPTARLTGTLTLASDVVLAGEVRPDRRAECRLTPEGFEDLMAQPLGAAVARIGPDMKLVLPAVPPGRFTLVCAAGAAGGTNGPQLGGWVEMPVLVDGRDQELALLLRPSMSFSGRVVFDGSAPPADLSTVGQVAVQGYGKARLLRSTFSSPIAADGAFKFSAIVPGRWDLSLTPSRSSPWTLKSITVGERELNTLIDVSAGSTPLEIVMTLTDRPTELAGALQDVAGRPAPDYFVIAFSTNRDVWQLASRWIQSTRPASDGTFLMKGLPAGEYYLAALTDVVPGEWFSPEFLSQVVPSALRVSITAGARTTQPIKIAK